MIAATFPLPALAKLLRCFMAEKLLVNDFVVSFGVRAEAGGDTAETVRPERASADTAARLPSLLSFFTCMRTSTFFRVAKPAVGLTAASIRVSFWTLISRMTKP